MLGAYECMAVQVPSGVGGLGGARSGTVVT